MIQNDLPCEIYKYHHSTKLYHEFVAVCIVI